jgi:hypothetical protein
MKHFNLCKRMLNFLYVLIFEADNQYENWLCTHIVPNTNAKLKSTYVSMKDYCTKYLSNTVKYYVFWRKPRILDLR